MSITKPRSTTTTSATTTSATTTHLESQHHGINQLRRQRLQGLRRSGARRKYAQVRCRRCSWCGARSSLTTGASTWARTGLLKALRKARIQLQCRLHQHELKQGPGRLCELKAPGVDGSRAKNRVEQRQQWQRATTRSHRQAEKHCTPYRSTPGWSTPCPNTAEMSSETEVG